MSEPRDDSGLDDFVIRDEPRLGDSRASVRRARSNESSAIWGLAIVMGVAIGGYALWTAAHPAPVAPAPSPPRAAVAPPAPVARPHPIPRLAVRAPAPSAPATAVATTVPNVPSAADAPRKAVDPIEGFETGEAFDNPPSPGRYGQRSSGLMDRGPAPPRPNRPDPSFGPR